MRKDKEVPSSERPLHSKREFYYSRLEKTPFPGYFVRRAFIKITNIDFGRAMKSVMTLSRRCGARARPGRRWRSVNTEGDGTQSLWILIISSFLQSFTICRANYILLPELYTQKNKIFRLLSGKDQADISPSSTPTWKCLFQPPDIYIPAALPLPSILIFWSCQDSG